MIRKLDIEDVHAWLVIAKEVEYLFGPMVGEQAFHDGIRESILAGNAFCLEVDGWGIGGIVAVDRENNEIGWLAVRRACRGNHYGEKLLEKAVAELDAGRPMIVQTFSGRIKEREGARKLYQKFGFKDDRDGGKNPAGYETVIMKRPA